MNRANLAISLERLAPPPLQQAVATAHALDVQAITFAGTPRPYTPGQPALSFLWDELDPAMRAATRALRAEFARGVIHAPFVDIFMVSANPYIQAESLRQIHQSIHAAGELALETVTVHAPLPAKGMTAQDFRRRLVLTLRELGRAAAAAGTRIGLENWRYPYDPEEHASILAEVDHPAVGATLDVGHIAYWFQHEGVTHLADGAAVAEYRRRLLAFIDRLGPRILHVHLHDVHAATLADHRTVGSGIIDYAPVLAGLARHGFDGILLLELGEADFPTALQASLAQSGPAVSPATNHTEANYA
jgi:sugar phosphate isomerase/epimerase